MIREIHQLECSICGASIRLPATTKKKTQFRELHDSPCTNSRKAMLRQKEREGQKDDSNTTAGQD